MPLLFCQLGVAGLRFERKEATVAAGKLGHDTQVLGELWRWTQDACVVTGFVGMKVAVTRCEAAAS